MKNIHSANERKDLEIKNRWRYFTKFLTQFFFLFLRLFSTFFHIFKKFFNKIFKSWKTFISLSLPYDRLFIIFYHASFCWAPNHSTFNRQLSLIISMNGVYISAARKKAQSLFWSCALSIAICWCFSLKWLLLCGSSSCRNVTW